MTLVMLAAGVAVMAGLALAGCGRLCGVALAGVSARGRAWCGAAVLAGAVLFSIAGVVVLALPAVLEVLPQRYLAAWPRLVSGSGPWAEAQGG